LKHALGRIDFRP